jgi:hypothetical protein
MAAIHSPLATMLAVLAFVITYSLKLTLIFRLILKDIWGRNGDCKDGKHCEINEKRVRSIIWRLVSF